MAATGATVAPAQETREHTPVQESGTSSNISNGSWSTATVDADNHVQRNQVATQNGYTNGTQSFNINLDDWSWVYAHHSWGGMWNAYISRKHRDTRGWSGSSGYLNLDQHFLHASGGAATGASHFGSAHNHFYQDWWSNFWNSRWDSEGFLKKLRDGDVPEWDGKTHRTIYFRKIDLWAASTGVPPELRAFRLLQKLSGQVFDKREKAYGPVEDYRVGKVMDEVLDDSPGRRIRK